jgi:glucosamine-6-phosphate deaminase
MRVLVTADYRTLSNTAAELLAKAVRARPGLTLGLPTGDTPLGMYEELVRTFREEQLDLSHVRTFNLDEYLGLPDGDHSYRGYMHDHFFSHINILPENTHIPDDNPGLYEKAIGEAGGIDLLVVGIGANGHIAFNEPGSSFASRSRIVTLAPETIANARQHFTGAVDVPRTAVTMGIATILEARRIVLLASGASKAGVVARALYGPVSETVPASVLQKHPNVIAILDEAAQGA